MVRECVSSESVCYVSSNRGIACECKKVSERIENGAYDVLYNFSAFRCLKRRIHTFTQNYEIIRACDDIWALLLPLITTARSQPVRIRLWTL